MRAAALVLMLFGACLSDHLRDLSREIDDRDVARWIWTCVAAGACTDAYNRDEQH